MFTIKEYINGSYIGSTEVLDYAYALEIARRIVGASRPCEMVVKITHVFHDDEGQITEEITQIFTNDIYTETKPKDTQC